jgi:hypothetical protein
MSKVLDFQVYPSDRFGGSKTLHAYASFIAINVVQKNKFAAAKEENKESLINIAQRFDTLVTRYTHEIDQLRQGYRIQYGVFLKEYTEAMLHMETLTEFNCEKYTLTFWLGMQTLELNFDTEDLSV